MPLSWEDRLRITLSWASNLCIGSEIPLAKRGKKGYASLKLDMSKAYDRVKWSYLVAVLKAFGFEDRWIGLLMNYVTSVSYSFKVNGHMVGKVTPSRELRQGDPLSPYLFMIYSQGLSNIINHASMQGVIQGITIARGNPMITQFFADDSLIFFKTTQKVCDAIKNCLSLYDRVSCQLINYDKSAITYSKHTPLNHMNYVQNSLHNRRC